MLIPTKNLLKLSSQSTRIVKPIDSIDDKRYAKAFTKNLISGPELTFAGVHSITNMRPLTRLLLQILSSYRSRS